MKPPSTLAPVSLSAGLVEIYRHLSSIRRRQLYAVTVLMVLGAVAEVATIGSVIPFLAVLANGPNGDLPRLAGFFDTLAKPIGTGDVAAAAFVFSAFAIATGILRLALSWHTQKFVSGLSHELAVNVLRRILHQPYAFHIDRDVAALLTATEKVDVFVFDTVLPVMQAAIAMFIATFLIAGLMYIGPSATLFAGVSLAAIYLLISVLTRTRLRANSAAAGKSYSERLKIVNEGLGGIRDVVIDNSELVYLGQFELVNGRLAEAKAKTAFIAASPRFVIEALGTVVIAAIAVVVSGRAGGVSLALPFIGALALGAQRLLPLIQTVYNGWAITSGNRSIIGQVLELLRLPMPANEAEPAVRPLPMRTGISFRNVSFSYPSRPNTPALRSVSFEIPASSMIALVGSTGSGKTTAADLLMGLLQPSEGEIMIDSTRLTPTNARAWQRNIAHVPQVIFLADTSIAKNIALGVPSEPLDRERVMDAARKAQLHDFIESLPDGYETTVGERGIRLSGGQRQRLGLARAIYKQSPVLVLDEATSALDETTEGAVLGALDDLRSEGRTIVIIAHRRSAIARCDRVVRLDQGSVLAIDILKTKFPRAHARRKRAG